MISFWLFSDPQRRFLKSAKPVSGMDLEKYGDLVAIDSAAGKIFAYRRNPTIDRIVVEVYTYQRRRQEQESWSISRINEISIDPNSFNHLMRMQFTDFNNQLVLLFETNNRKNIIWFQYQTDAQNPDPEIWHINHPTWADRMHSSPSTGRVYLGYFHHQRIEEYGFSDGLHIRSISLDIFKVSVNVYPDFRFYHADDQLHIGIGSWKKVATVPIDALDEQHMSVRRFRRRYGWLVDWVADKHNNMIVLSNEGDSYGLSFAPANNRERLRWLATIPMLKVSQNVRNRMIFDEDRGLVFLTLTENKDIHCYRVATMN